MPAGLLAGNAGTRRQEGPWRTAVKSVAFGFCVGHTWAFPCVLGFLVTLTFSAAEKKGETFVLHRPKFDDF